jgi:hypothetical protein
MRGLDPRIHPSSQDSSKEMDCRVKPGNDEKIPVTGCRDPKQAEMGWRRSVATIRMQLQGFVATSGGSWLLSIRSA